MAEGEQPMVGPIPIRNSLQHPLECNVSYFPFKMKNPLRLALKQVL